MQRVLLAAAPHVWLAWVSVACSVAIAAFGLFREDLPGWLRDTSERALGPVFKGLETLHSGLIGDYVTRISVGFAAVVAAFAIN